jgi:hypothetical protein
MKKHLKNYFIPHEKNDHKPHFLRKDSLAFIIAVFVVLEGAFILGSLTLFKDSNFLAAVLPSTLITLTNENRAAYKVKELKENPTLVSAAQLKAQDMAAKSYFSHTSPEGLTPWHWLDKAGYSYLYAGENLAVNFDDSKDVSDAWMKSPAHKDNIVNNHYTEIGIATSRGIYKGREVTFVVEFFGQPLTPSPAEWRDVIAEKSKATLPAPVRSAVVTAPTPASKTNTQSKNVVVEKGSLSIVDQENIKQVKGEETSLPMAESGPLVKLAESPRTALATVLLGAIMLLSVALALAILIKIKIQHPRMIAGTLFVILVAIGILYFNSEIFISMTEVPTDTNYASVFKAF